VFCWHLWRKYQDPDPGSGAISQRHRFADPDLDPHQNVMNPQHWYPERSKKTDSEKALLTSYFVYLAMFWIRNNLDGTIRIQNSPIGRCGFATLIPPVSRFLIRKEKNDCYDHPNNFSSFSSFSFCPSKKNTKTPGVSRGRGRGRGTGRGRGRGGNNEAVRVFTPGSYPMQVCPYDFVKYCRPVLCVST
jgi:hypothetical protein